jgi:tetratricopeptide (TPR) repeat protein
VTDTQPDSPLTLELEDAIRVGYEQRDRRKMAPTIAYFRELLSKHPDNPVLVYEVGGAYDTAGEEETARGYYERALAMGLAGDVRRRCLCQYGSTLRWLGRLEESMAVLDDAQAEFPNSESVHVFRALTLLDSGRGDQAASELLGALLDHADETDLGRWAEGLRGLAGWLATGRPD